MSADSSMRVVLRKATLHLHTRAGDVRDDLPVLLFLHYFGGSGRSWIPVMDLLACGDFYCIAPDLRGFGESLATTDRARDYSVRSWSNDVVELTRFLALRRFVLVGHSMGGKIALMVAARAPAGLEAVVLVAPSPPTAEPMPAKERARLLEGYGDAAAARQTLRKITAQPLSRARVALAVEDNLRTSPAAWRAWLERGSRENISAKLNAVNAPVSIIVGGADETITASLVRREINARLRLHTVVHTIPNAGHLLPLEAPLPIASFITESTAGAVVPR